MAQAKANIEEHFILVGLLEKVALKLTPDREEKFESLKLGLCKETLSMNKDPLGFFYTAYLYKTTQLVVDSYNMFSINLLSLEAQIKDLLNFELLFRFFLN